MLLCIHCALVALVGGVPYIPRDESPAAHLARAHPNGVDPAERQRLEREAERIIQRGDQHAS